MNTWVRTLLVWCLVLALPIQGAAAATMARCGSHHSAPAGGGVAAAVETMADADADADAGAHAGHHGHAHEKHSSSAADVTDPDPAPGANLATADPHKCSACAACCSVAVIGRMVLAVPAPDLASTVLIAVVPTVEKFSADGPDRPPRAFVV